jgi:hypothetical protein
MKITKKEILKHYMLSANMAAKFVEIEARKILKTHPNLDEFVMGMGGWFFTRKIGTIGRHRMKVIPEESNTIYDNPKYIEHSPLANFLGEWDSDLHITGYPMRFTATGPIRTDW